MLGMALGLALGAVVMGIMSRKFPPKLQAHADGPIWLSLR